MQLLSQAVEDVFSSPAVLLETFHAAAPEEAEGGQLSSSNNRGGEASGASHGLDLTYVNALYTAILKAGHSPKDLSLY